MCSKLRSTIYFIVLYLMKKPKRILLKLSGEALKWKRESWIDIQFINTLAEKIKTLHDRGIEIALVLGAGNIFRGVAGAVMWLDRTTGDYMGMLWTIINALAMGNILTQHGMEARVMSSIETPRVAEPFIRKRALKHLQKWRIVLCAAGTGNPYFSTDSSAILRWLELWCDMVVKWTKVDGVYNKDPMKYDDAVKFDTMRIEDALEGNIRVMDHNAIAMAKDEKMPIYVCHIDQIDLLGTEKICGTMVE